MGGEVGSRGGDGFKLVFIRRARNGGRNGAAAMRLEFDQGPIDGGRDKIPQPDFHDGRNLVEKRRLRIIRPFVGRRDPKAAREPLGFQCSITETFAGGGEERIHGFLSDVGIVLIAFALNSPIPARHRQRNKIDAEVVARAKILAKRKIAPQPHLVKHAFVLWQIEKVCAHQLLELRAFLRFGKRVGTVLPQDSKKSLDTCLVGKPVGICRYALFHGRDATTSQLHEKSTFSIHAIAGSPTTGLPSHTGERALVGRVLLAID